MTFIDELLNAMPEILHAGTLHSFYISEEACYIKYCCVNCDCNKYYTRKLYIVRLCLLLSCCYSAFSNTLLPLHPFSLYPIPLPPSPLPLHPSTIFDLVHQIRSIRSAAIFNPSAILDLPAELLTTQFSP